MCAVVEDVSENDCHIMRLSDFDTCMYVCKVLKPCCKTGVISPPLLARVSLQSCDCATGRFILDLPIAVRQLSEVEPCSLYGLFVFLALQLVAAASKSASAAGFSPRRTVPTSAVAVALLLASQLGRQSITLLALRLVRAHSPFLCTSRSNDLCLAWGILNHIHTADFVASYT